MLRRLQKLICVRKGFRRATLGVRKTLKRAHTRATRREGRQIISEALQDDL